MTMPVGVAPAPVETRRAPRPGGRRRTLLYLHELRALLRIAGPIIVSQLGHIAMNTTDTIMVGPLGAGPLAAAGLGRHASAPPARHAVARAEVFVMG